MADSGRPWQVYSLIGVGIIGVIVLLWWFLSQRGEPSSPTEPPLRDHHIIVSDSLPVACQSFKEAMNCLIIDNSEDNLKTSLSNYYRETLAVWNTLSPDQLTSLCQQSLSYIQQQVASFSGNIRNCLSL